MKNTLILALILSVTNPVLTQNYKPSATKQYQSLIDEVFILTLFVDTEVDYWTDEEQAYYVDELHKSQAWLIDQAWRYDQYLTFNNDYFLRNNEIVYIEEASRSSSFQLLNKVMREMNHDGIDEFMDYNNFDFTKQKLKVVLFVKSNSRSHAYNYWSNSEVDVAVVYCRSTMGMQTDHKTISHEILHQFGAWDLYFGTSQSEEKAAQLKELYPHSIMISTWNNWAAEVDELTAWRVGWNTEFKPLYNEFTPVRDSKRSSSSRQKTTITIPMRRKRTGGG